MTYVPTQCSGVDSVSRWNMYSQRLHVTPTLQKETRLRSTSTPLPHFHQFPKWFKGQDGKKTQMKAEKREEKLQTQNCIKYVGRSSWAEIRLFPEYYGDCELHPPPQPPHQNLCSPSPSLASFCERNRVSLSTCNGVHNLKLIPRHRLIYSGFHEAQGTWIRHYATGFESQQGQEILFSPKRPYQLGSPPSTLFNW